MAEQESRLYVPPEDLPGISAGRVVKGLPDTRHGTASTVPFLR